MKISLLTLYYLFVEIAFLFPRGYGEYSEIYHLIMTLLVWSAVMLITITEIPKIIKHSKRVSSNSKMIAVYFLMAIIITIVIAIMIIMALTYSQTWIRYGLLIAIVCVSIIFKNKILEAISALRK